MSFDVNPRLPIKAIFIGGPQHGKQLNLEEKAISDGHKVIESNMYAHSVPTDNGYHESTYRFFRRENNGNLHLFVHETVLADQAWRVPMDLDKQKKDAAKLRDSLAEVRAESSEAKTKLKEALVQIEALEARLERVSRFNVLVGLAMTEIATAVKGDK